MSKGSNNILPQGWAYTSIPQIIAKDGVFCDGDWVESKDQDPNGEIRLIQLADVGDGVYRNKSCRFLTRKKFKELNCTQILPQDVLVARMPDPLGRACIFTGDRKDCITVVDVCMIRAGTVGPDHKWLMYTINSPHFRSEIASRQSGSTRKRISRKNFSKIEFPLAPLNEQKRIVAKIEQLFSDLDAGVETLHALKKQIKQYRQSVLKHAFEGKLTAEWRKKNKPEPASKLLEKIAKEKGQKSNGKKQKKLPQLDTSDLPTLPKEWEWVVLDDISDVKGGITKDQKKKFKDGRTIPYLRVANVQRGYLDLSEIKEIEASEDIIQSLLLEKGDILFTEGGDRDKLGRGCVWNEEIPECIHQNHIFRARLLSDQIDSRLISWHGNTFGQSYFMKQGKQTTNLASINLTKLRHFPVPIIPHTEQVELISIIERHFSIAEKAEEVVETALKQSSRLRQSILKRAFEGKLVSQDPTDEPAGKLLERIRKEKV